MKTLSYLRLFFSRDPFYRSTGWRCLKSHFLPYRTAEIDFDRWHEAEETGELPVGPWEWNPPTVLPRRLRVRFAPRKGRGG